MFVLTCYISGEGLQGTNVLVGCYSTREKAREARIRHYDEYSSSHQLGYRIIETELDQYQDKTL